VSDSARPDLAAFRELEQLIRALGDEMAAWRRRAHEAEARLKATEARLARQGSPAEQAPPAAPAAAAAPPDRSTAALQRENQELRLKLESARQRTKQLMDRVRFLRQQHEIGSAER
jgi:glutathione S-transferase